MKTPFALLAATTALTASLGLPAWTTPRAPTAYQSVPTAIPAQPLIRVSGEDDDACEDDEGEDEDGDDDHDDTCPAAPGAAPAGSATPPANGLFGAGSAPRAQVN